GRQRPLADVDAPGRGQLRRRILEIGVRFDEAPGEEGLADAALPDQQQLGLLDQLDRTLLQGVEVALDGRQAPRGDLGWGRGERVPSEMQLFQVREPYQGARDLLDTVAAQIERFEVLQTEDRSGDLMEASVCQRQDPQLGEVYEPGGDRQTV